MPEASGRVWRFGDDVSTDDILPGRYAPFMVGEEAYPSHAFAHLRPEFAAAVRPGDIIVAGRNFGLGSSREYAPRALARLGVALIVARSFARIHYRNLVNLGLPPLVDAELASALADGDRITLDLEAGTLRREGRRFRLPPLPELLREVRAEGSVLAFVRRHGRLPGDAPAAGHGKEPT